MWGSDSAQKNVASVMGALSSTSSSFGNAAASTRLDNQPNGALFIDDTLKQQALAEEEAAMNQYKVNHDMNYLNGTLNCTRLC